MAGDISKDFWQASCQTYNRSARWSIRFDRVPPFAENSSHTPNCNSVWVAFPVDGSRSWCIVDLVGKLSELLKGIKDWGFLRCEIQ